MENKTIVGITAAIFAAFAWSLNFVAPYFMGSYTIYDLAVIRYLLSGVMGLAILVFRGKGRGTSTLRDWLVAAWLGFLGYVGYFLTISAAIIYAGPIIPPAFVATVPVVLAIVGNFGADRVAWSRLALPLGCALVGLLLVNANGLVQASSGSFHDMALGIGFSVGAVTLWTLFGVQNQRALRKRPKADALTWTALMMTAGAFECLAFIPFGLALDLFGVVHVGLQSPDLVPVLLCALALAVMGSIGGSWAWSIATRNLPIGLAGQLIVTETLFALGFGLVAHHRWPSAPEALGMCILLAGVVSAVGAFHSRRTAILH